MCVQLQRQVTFKYSYPIVKTIPENSSQEWNAALSFIVTIVAALFSSLLPLPSLVCTTYCYWYWYWYWHWHWQKVQVQPFISCICIFLWNGKTYFVPPATATARRNLPARPGQRSIHAWDREMNNNNTRLPPTEGNDEKNTSENRHKCEPTQVWTGSGSGTPAWTISSGVGLLILP